MLNVVTIRLNNNNMNTIQVVHIICCFFLFWLPLCQKIIPRCENSKMFVCQHCISNCNQNQQETGGCWTLTRFIFVIREVSRFYTDIQALIWEVCISLIETLATVNDHTDILLCNVFCHPVSKYVNTNREQRFSYQHHQLWHKHQLLWARQFFLWLWKILRPSYCFSAVHV